MYGMKKEYILRIQINRPKDEHVARMCMYEWMQDKRIKAGKWPLFKKFPLVRTTSQSNR